MDLDVRRADGRGDADPRDGQGSASKGTKSQARVSACFIAPWASPCSDSERRLASHREPIFATVGRRLSGPEERQRGLAMARGVRLGFGWVTAHSWRKTMATILDTSGASARMIADQLGHSRVSMSQDFYLGRKSADVMVLAALEQADPRPAARKKGAKKVAEVVSDAQSQYLSLVREPTRGLEPLTPCLQDRCATDCATPARSTEGPRDRGRCYRCPRPAPTGTSNRQAHRTDSDPTATATTSRRREGGTPML